MGSKSKSSSKAQSRSSFNSSKSSRDMDQVAKTPPSTSPQAIVPYQGPPPPPPSMTPSQVWKAMKKRDFLGNRNTTAIAVVGPEQVKELKKLVEGKKKNFECKIIVTTPNRLQDKLDALTEAGHKIPGLHLLVSSAIESITYHISGLVRNACIWPCTKGRPDGLRIGNRSTYCDFLTYAWDNRPADIRNAGRRITHQEGCHWDLRDCLDEARELLKPALVPTPSLPEDYLAKAMDQFSEVREKHMRPQGGLSPHSSNQTPSESEPGWLIPWKSILWTAFSAVAAAAGYRGFAGFFWYNNAGLLVKGPFGLSLALGHTTSVISGGWASLLAPTAAAAAVPGAMLAAGVLLYYVPKDTVFEFLKRTFRKIWDAVCDIAAWLWEKVKGLSTTFCALF